MANSEKSMSASDANQNLRFAFNEQDKTLTTGSFIASKIGHKITQTAFNSTTDDFSYYDGSSLLYTIRVVYTSTAKDTLSSVERIA
jgi:hypothetical protein